MFERELTLACRIASAGDRPTSCHCLSIGISIDNRIELGEGTFETAEVKCIIRTDRKSTRLNSSHQR